MPFILKFKTENAAFWDGNGVEEVARILRETAEYVAHYGVHSGSIQDINGNTIGEWDLELPEDETEDDDDDDEIDHSCNHCQASMINRAYCHETGCPNSRKVKVDGEWMEAETDEDEMECE